ncbi:MAG TPA: RT0821/Lpp0805 family surface protein [Methylocella sp.]|jgi:surface antigen|nr:RT0821/Lpp0805 family surface protein [Methylocella sp.]
MACRSGAIFRFPYFWHFGRKPLSRAAKACILGGLPAMLAGCSMAFPISPLMSPSTKEDATGAIPKSSLAGLLDAEDWRRAKAALSTALDPQGNGSLVGWDNPDSGNKGSFTPVGKPFPLEARICRVFLAKLDCKGDEHAMQGTACSDKRGEWTIAEAKPWKKT